MTIDSTATYCWHPRVASRTLEETAFVLQGSRMVSLNPTGSRIWELFRDGATIKAVAEAIAGEFETSVETAERDTVAFATELLERELLVAAPPRTHQEQPGDAP